MILLREVELAHRNDIGGYRRTKPGFLSELRFQSNLMLFFVGVEDRGPVLQRVGWNSGVMTIPESVEELFVGHSGWVIFHLDGLAVIADMVIGGVTGCAAGVAHPRADNSVNAPELGIGAPESAQGKGCGLDECRGFDVNGR